MSCAFRLDSGALCTVEGEHRHCAACGYVLLLAASLCTHHHAIYGDDWAEGNRIMCDFLHRGKQDAA